MYYGLILSLLLSTSGSEIITNDNDKVTKNKIDNYEVITISQSGSLFYSVTRDILESVKNLNTNVTFIGRANVGLNSINRESETILQSRNNYLYNLSIKTVEASSANLFYKNEVVNTLENNKVVVSSLTAERYGLKIGDELNLIGLNGESLSIEVGLIEKDSVLGWFEAIVNKEIGYQIGINRNIQAIIWDNKIDENFLIELHRNINYKKVRFTNKGSKPNKNWVLPTALVKEYFGDFQIKERDGVWITTEPSWRNQNIEQKRMPILGLTVCHKLMWEPLEGALNQIINEGLSDQLKVNEFKEAGGCYAPRRIARFDAGGSISRHAWGIAIDINTKSGYPTRIVEIFNSWGFAWGGTWTSPDEMHFELRDLSASISKASS